MYGIKDYLNTVTQNFVLVVAAINNLITSETDEEKLAKLQSLRDKLGDACTPYIVAVQEYLTQERAAIHDLADTIIGDPPDNQTLVDSAATLNEFATDFKSVDTELDSLVAILGA